MNILIQNKIVYAFVLCSIVLTCAYGIGGFDKQLDVLNSENLFNAQAVKNNSEARDLAFSGNKNLVATCQIEDATSSTNKCGIVFHVNNAISKGIDFSDYSNLSINTLLVAPVNNPKVRIGLRNFSDKYSSTINVNTLKINNMVLKPSSDSKQSKTVDIPLEYLSVDNNWVKQYDVAIEDAQVELNNIAMLELFHSSTDVPGQYKIIINALVFKGKHFNLSQLLIANLILWSLAIFFLIKRQGQSLLELSTIDLLTGLPNRRGLQVWIEALRISELCPQNITVCYIDIDDFKTTNDTFGHNAGDLLLQGFCKRIQVVVDTYKNPQNSLFFARMSGDEFVVICKSIDSDLIVEFANEVFNALKEPLVIENNLIQINMSLGISQEPMISEDTTEIFKHADAAMYIAKQSGKNQFRIYKPNVDEEIIQDKSIAKIISDAIALNQFDLKFMPIFDFNTKVVKCVEVLIYSDTPDLDGFSTRKIISIAEEFNLINELDEWILNNTLELLSENTELIEKLDLKFCINVSSLDFQDKSFFERTKMSIEKYKIPATRIELEIKENALSNHSEDCTSCLEQLRSLGVTLTLDDFGTGYTAFNQLINYPVNKIKIDSTYVSAIGTGDTKIKVITDAIINIAETFDLQVTAVGIESLEQYYYFANKGCDFAQGSLLSEPLTLRELVRGLRNQETFAVESKVSA